MKVLACICAGFVAANAYAQESVGGEGAALDSATENNSSIAEYRFNTAAVEFIGSGASTDIQQNGVSLHYEIVDVKRTPELGESRTIQGRDLLLYQETAIANIFTAELSAPVSVGKARSSVTFDAATKFEMMLIDNSPAVCEVGEPERRQPYAPQATCLIDSEKNSTFDKMRTRRAGQAKFSRAKKIEPVDYIQDTQRAELYFRNQDKPVPGFRASVQGWNENAARVQISPIVPVETRAFGEGTLSIDDVNKIFEQSKSTTVLDVIYGEDGAVALPGGVRITVTDAKWKTLTYHVERGFDPWYGERTDTD